MNKDREQVINVIEKHVNNEYLTSRELAEIVLDLALVQSTNEDEFVDSIKELCEKDEDTLLVWHTRLFGGSKK